MAVLRSTVPQHLGKRKRGEEHLTVLKEMQSADLAQQELNRAQQEPNREQQEPNRAQQEPNRAQQERHLQLALTLIQQLQDPEQQWPSAHTARGHSSLDVMKARPSWPISCSSQSKHTDRVQVSRTSWKTLDWSRASFTAFKWRRRSRATIQGPDQYHDPPVSLEQSEGGVHQTLTADLLTNYLHLQRKPLMDEARHCIRIYQLPLVF
ncbi:hypothetical protein NQZ68_021809 [Dissostichus eleginoides]|nr:hypothetical protein NQZ68_021809 [Dissostichus eleginoides]